MSIAVDADVDKQMSGWGGVSGGGGSRQAIDRLSRICSIIAGGEVSIPKRKKNTESVFEQSVF